MVNGFGAQALSKTQENVSEPQGIEPATSGGK